MVPRYCRVSFFGGAGVKRASQRVGGGDEVSSGKGGAQGHHLVAGDDSARRMAQIQVSVNQLWQSKMPG